MIISWLKNVQPPKFLRYFFFISYSRYRGYASERDDAHFTSALFLAFIHLFIVFWFSTVLVSKEFLVQTNKYVRVIPILILLAVIHYYLFLYKNKWKAYVQEFKHLTKPQRKKGTLLLLLYLFSAIALAASPIYFGEIERNKIREEKLKEESTRVYNSYGIAKCVLVDIGNSEDFVFFEFYVDGQKVKGATAIAKGSGSGLEGGYFKVNYSSRNNRESILLVNEQVKDLARIKAAGFE